MTSLITSITHSHLPRLCPVNSTRNLVTDLPAFLGISNSLLSSEAFQSPINQSIKYPPMKLRATLAAFSLFLAAHGIASAEDSLIQDGDFASWSDGVPASWNVGTTEGGSVTEITTASGKGVLVQNLAQVSQKISPAARSFTVSFIFTVNQAPDFSEFSQSLSLHLYQTNNPRNSAMPRMPGSACAFNPSMSASSPSALPSGIKTTGRI